MGAMTTPLARSDNPDGHGAPFLKMNGLGNDFVVVDARKGPAFAPSVERIRALGRREGGVGFDQLIAIEPSANGDAFMRIWNADGGEVEACGNATRCVGWLLLREGRASARIDTAAGLLEAFHAGETLVSVDMGAPRLDWTEIPLSEQMDTRRVELQVGPIDAPVLHTPGCVNMGNPHVTFFVADAETAPVAEVGPLIEHHPLFPEGVNVGFAQIVAPDRIRFRVWERGVGITRACGTGACAALVAAHRRLLCERKAVVVMDGGELVVDWRAEDGHVWMTGPAMLDYEGLLP
jgi:diaminopimelate epimerase